jgi:hypothetical protein
MCVLFGVSLEVGSLLRFPQNVRGQRCGASRRSRNTAPDDIETKGGIMNEAARQRKYVKGLRLIEEAFTVLRGPLEIDDKESPARDEVYVAQCLAKARDALHTIIQERTRQGISAAPKDE